MCAPIFEPTSITVAPGLINQCDLAPCVHHAVVRTSESSQTNRNRERVGPKLRRVIRIQFALGAVRMSVAVVNPHVDHAVAVRVELAPHDFTCVK